MVAIQQVEYGPGGEIKEPRPQLLAIHREPNGEFSANPDHWHRHTIAAPNAKSFEESLGRLKKLLAQSGAEVFRIERSSATVVDVIYLLESKKRTAQIARDVARGQCPPELTTYELTPSC